MLYKAYKNLVFPFILFILNTGCDGGVDFAGLPLERGAVFSDVRIPLARKDHLNPDLIIRIEKIDVSSKKFNYLIISVIPEVTFRGLKIEILGSDNSSSWCDLLNDFPPLTLSFSKCAWRGLHSFVTGTLQCKSALKWD